MAKTPRPFWKKSPAAPEAAPVTRESLQRDYTQACCEEGDIRFKQKQQENRLKELDRKRFELAEQLDALEFKENAERVRKQAAALADKKAASDRQHELAAAATGSLPTAPPEA